MRIVMRIMQRRRLNITLTDAASAVLEDVPERERASFISRLIEESASGAPEVEVPALLRRALRLLGTSLVRGRNGGS
jgi:hypothetical protein